MKGVLRSLTGHNPARKEAATFPDKIRGAASLLKREHWEDTMYEVTIRKTFSAAHVLREADGSLEELHGHNFAAEISVTGERLNREDLLIDFRILKGWINETIARLDHKHLNNLEAFNKSNPSSELVAKLIFDAIAPKAAALNLCISRVTIWESEDARVTYEESRMPLP